MSNLTQYLLDRIWLRLRWPEPTHQIAALPYDIIHGRAVFLLITSRRSGRWIVPKGSVVAGETPWRSAEIEAFEEAGVEGIAENEPIGSYRTIKKGGMRRRVVEVDLYPLRVTKQNDTWPEQANRHRHWVLLREAKRLLSDPDLADLVSEFSRRAGSSVQPEIQRIEA